MSEAGVNQKRSCFELFAQFDPWLLLAVIQRRAFVQADTYSSKILCHSVV